MKLDEHFVNKVAATKTIRDFSEKISKIALDLKTAENVKEFENALKTLKSLSESNVREINKLL